MVSKKYTVFLMGHPASGKSTLYHLLETRLIDAGRTVRRINDREFFWKVIEEDKNQKLHFIQNNGEVQVRNRQFYQRQYELISKALRFRNWPEDILFIELTSSDLPFALDELGTDLLSEARLLLLLSLLDIALARNEMREINSVNLDHRCIPTSYIVDCYKQPFTLDQLPPLFSSHRTFHNDNQDPSTLYDIAQQCISWLLEDT